MILEDLSKKEGDATAGGKGASAAQGSLATLLAANRSSESAIAKPSEAVGATGGATGGASMVGGAADGSTGTGTGGAAGGATSGAASGAAGGAASGAADTPKSIALLQAIGSGGTQQNLLEQILASPLTSEAFVQHTVAQTSFLMQLIVERGGHMAAISYHTHKAVADAPKRVLPGASYWSFDYENLRTQACLVAALYTFGVFTILHDWRELWAWMRASKKVLHSRKHGLAFGAYDFLVKAPSVVVPLFLEAIRPELPLPTWVFWVTCTELLLSLRLVQ